ncbi:MAG: riboflavin biosynthesis protein RibD [Chloroflexi bacterium RBG_16_54_18]|nr:MAG: riboflavin biosynthesis protein RibD [Chloroflexi bacterium RBG_16_54_18]
MRKIITTTFLTLDGVMQAPGGPEEDPTNGFRWGGWSFHYFDETMGNVMNEFMNRPFELLLGRRTYEIFAAHWPFVKNDPVADQFNRTRKYVVSHRPMQLTWQNSTLVTGDVAAELINLKQQNGDDLWVHGSGKLIQTLLANHLVDRLYVWTFPVTVGEGKRLFSEGTQPEGLRLVDAKVSTTGVIIASYEPVGDLVTGSFALEQPTETELERRKRLAKEKG